MGKGNNRQENSSSLVWFIFNKEKKLEIPPFTGPKNKLKRPGFAGPGFFKKITEYGKFVS